MSSSAGRGPVRRAPYTLVILALSVTLLAGGAAAACGGSGPEETPAPSPADDTATAPPADGTPQRRGEGVIDLAGYQPLATFYGADGDDFLNDLPALVTGDVNGDGVDDLLIGARFGDGPGNERPDSGEAYILYGRPDLPEVIDVSAGEQDVTVFGSKQGEQLAFSGILADINGDRFADIILGAPFADSGAELGAGVVYVIFGRPELPAVIDLAPAGGGGADVTLVGPGAGSFFGDHAAATDIDGDGIRDLIVGATFARRPLGMPNPGAQAGAAFAVFGRETFPPTLRMADGDYDVAIYGENDDPHPDELGDTVAGGDINDDGYGDIIVTAEAADGPGNARSVAAEVHVLFGRPGLSGVFDIGAGDQDMVVYGAEQNDTLGFNLYAADINGDGVDDLLMSARGGDGPGNFDGEAGEVHVVFGRPDLPRVIDLLEDESDAYLYGADPADMLAYTVFAADLDGDDVAELLVGTGFADGPDNSRRDAGELYVVDARSLSGPRRGGGPLRVTEAALKLVVYGARPGDGLGAAATVGDLTGDGEPELVTLAQRAGEVYIIQP